MHPLGKCTTPICSSLVTACPLASACSSTATLQPHLRYPAISRPRLRRRIPTLPPPGRFPHTARASPVRHRCSLPHRVACSRAAWRRRHSSRGWIDPFILEGRGELASMGNIPLWVHPKLPPITTKRGSKWVEPVLTHIDPPSKHYLK